MIWALSTNDAPLILFAVLWLILLEGLLSADNALVLAMMVRHLPKTEQKRALRYGIWGAFAFRVVAVLAAKLLLDFWFLKVLGGAYLLYLAFSHFFTRGSHADDEGGVQRVGRSFWGTVVSVELADIAFSIDSILAAVAMAEGLPDRIGGNAKFGVVIVGGILGILTMRFVAGRFIILLEKFPGLENGAYGLVAWIGLKLTIGGFHTAHYVPWELHEWTFWTGMLVILSVSLLVSPKKKAAPDAETSAALDAVNRMASGESQGLDDEETDPMDEQGQEAMDEEPESTEIIDEGDPLNGTPTHRDS